MRSYVRRQRTLIDSFGRDVMVDGHDKVTEIQKPIEYDKGLYPTAESLVRDVWEMLFQKPPTTTQLDMVNCLDVKDGYPAGSKILMAWRGAAKSLITSVYCIYRLWHNPDLKVLMVSARPERAFQGSEFIKRTLVTLPNLIPMVPLSHQRRGTRVFDVASASPSHMPSVKSVGINQTITGFRADLIICDDIEIFEDGLRKPVDLLPKIIELINLLTPTGEMVFLGTFQKRDSVYLRLVYEGIVKSAFMWPVLTPESIEQPIPKWEYGNYIKYLAKFLPPNSDFDERFTESVITDRKSDLKSYPTVFDIQYLLKLDAFDKTSNAFSINDLCFLDMRGFAFKDYAPEQLRLSQIPSNFPHIGQVFTYVHSGGMVEYTQKILVIDPSGEGGQSDTAFVVLGIARGKIYMLDCGSYNDGYGEMTLTAIANAAKSWDVPVVAIEKTYGGGIFSKLIAPYFFKIKPVRIDEINVTKYSGELGKLNRILHQLLPVISARKLVINTDIFTKTDAEKETSFTYQLATISNILLPKKNDLVDALALGVASLTPLLSYFDSPDNSYEKISFQRLSLRGGKLV